MNCSLSHDRLGTNTPRLLETTEVPVDVALCKAVEIRAALRQDAFYPVRESC